MATDTGIVLFPRFTTLVADDSSNTRSFTSTPLDVSQFGSAQFQLWRGPLVGSSATFKAYLEESLDGENWMSPPGGAGGFDPGTGALKMFSYAFRLRWFRVRVDFKGKYVTCWAEGFLR